ncbi:Golgi-associated plant pathogenesis-related protein 1 [Taenia solium]|eukprot:TsM_000720000 transcript=TsM_000720000 gene=TsM_000720000
MALALAESAQSYSEVLVRDTSFQHSRISDVGENLAKLSGSLSMKDLSAAQVTLSWYNEIKNYHFVGEDPIRCGHFSQLIWQSTTAMGMGIAESADGRTVIVVAHYQPQGNCIGQWSANVPRLLHGTPHTFTLEELTKAMNADSKSDEKEKSVTSRNRKHSLQDANQMPEKEVTASNFTLAPPTETNEKSTGSVSKKTVDFAPLNARQIDESEAFAMEVFMVLNQRRIALGLPPFLLNEDLDYLAQELAKELRSGESRGIPEGNWQGRRTRHYAKSSCLLDKSVADPNCKYVAIGCELNPPFKRSSVVLLFA